MGKSNGEAPTRPETMAPITGNTWVPVWAVRPGAYEALAPIAGCMPTWLALHSRNGDVWRPCYASQSQLGATIGTGRGVVARHLVALCKASLLLEIERGKDPKTQRPRPPARWALDPHGADIWRERIEAMLARIAEEDGQDGRWLQRAVASLEAFERRSRIMGARIAVDMPVSPVTRRKRKRRKGSQGAVYQKEAGGEGFTRGGAVNAVEVKAVQIGRAKIGRADDAAAPVTYQKRNGH